MPENKASAGGTNPLPYQSSLERHPDIVQAIGMVNIEIGNLDVVLADLLAVLLNKPSAIGQVIYHAPKGEMARIAIVEDVVAYMFIDVKKGSLHEGLLPLKDKLEGWMARSKAVIGKRHDMIHSNWGLDSVTLAVTRSRQPLVEAEKKAVKIEDLRRIIGDTRQLITEVYESHDDIHRAMYPKGKT